jgi:polyhydroxyalkanoate synthesis regulator phasin
MAIFEIIRNAMLLGFGVQEKVKEFVDEVVKKGELSESQGAKLVREWTEKAEKNTEDISNTLNDLLKKTIDKMKLPSKEDLDKMSEEISTLAERIKKLEENKG